MTKEDVDFYRDVARQARAEIDAEILTIQEALAEGPYPDACVFASGYFLDRSRIPETQVLAWREEDFDPSWARYSYAVATPDEDAEHPSHRIEEMRQDVAAVDGATVVFDGSFDGFCPGRRPPVPARTRWSLATLSARMVSPS